jgi:hypothetical protein
MSSASSGRKPRGLRAPWLTLCLTIFFSTAARAAVVVADPGNPAAPASTTASMTAGGIAIPVKTETVNYSTSTRLYDVAKFTVSAPTSAVITASAPISSYSISPTLAGVSASVSGSQLTVSLPGPVNLVIHINSQPDLLLLATPAETETYTASGPGVVYFGPGVHTTGIISCTSNTTYYLAPGALVKGVFNMFGVHDVRIIGRGLIDGAADSGTVFTQPVIYANNASGVKVQGVGVRNANGVQSHYYNSDHIDISYVNMLGGLVINHDGIDLDGAEDVTIRNSIIYSGDDGFGWHALGSGNQAIGTVPNFPMARVLADNVVIFNDVAGNAFRLGASFETDYVRDLTLSNIYALHWHEAAVEGDVSDYANIRNVTLENWMVTANLPTVIEVALAPTRWTNPVSGYLPGTIDGLYFRDFTATGASATGFSILGYDATHRVSGVSVENVSLGGHQILSPSQVTTNAYVDPITFSATELSHPEPTDGVVAVGDSGFSTTGTWHTSTLTGFNGGPTLYSSTAGSTATWTPALAQAGYYTVYVRYPYNDNSTLAANYTVQYAGGSSSFTVDQTGLAGIWRSLGVFPFSAGNSGSVTVTAAGITRADAVRFEPAIIIDNTDPGFAKTGVWYNSTLTGFNQSSTLYANGGGATATWTPTLPTTGRYAVYVWFPAYSNSDTAATYTVTSADGSSNVVVNQQQYAGKWRSLGIFDFDVGTSGSVQLTSSNSNTRADAAYFVLIPP